MRKSVVIIGGGLVGTMLGCVLGQRGFQVDIYEKRPDLRKQGLSGGRSINLALSHRGLKALRLIGVEEQLNPILIPMKGRMMHDTTGKRTFQAYSQEGYHINSVSRSKLNAFLLDAAEQFPHVRIHFEHDCRKIDLAAQEIQFRLKDGSLKTVSYEWLFGGDGAFSPVRRALINTDRFNFSQTFLEYGYKELSIPPTPTNEFALEPHALHIWPRQSFMLIALPNPDKTFTATLFLPFEGKDSFESLNTPEAVKTFFQTYFPDALSLMPHLETEFFKNPTASLVMIKCQPWVKGNVALIGDAAHAIVPFYGQGMNAGFEDCFVLNQLLDEHNDDLRIVLPRYQQLRIPDANAIAELAMQNFIEMRDLVGKPAFLLRKTIEDKIHQQVPQWIPLYSMVTFSDMRYSEALKIGKWQDEVMQSIMNDSNVLAQWEHLDFSSDPRLIDFVAKVMACQ
ncbi:MAG: FAD-dependent monooxygenase [Flammeovirgaceae bacterium]|nr:FAD-dependent monooxygenase [Flammeovirgaceae bacterium]MDW8287072.1 NAD(P)/FAD-dependent oxidoreductase [Flammeovirgaceae bacterium]